MDEPMNGHEEADHFEYDPDISYSPPPNDENQPNPREVIDEPREPFESPKSEHFESPKPEPVGSPKLEPEEAPVDEAKFQQEIDEQLGID